MQLQQQVLRDEAAYSHDDKRCADGGVQVSLVFHKATVDSPTPDLLEKKSDAMLFGSEISHIPSRITYQHTYLPYSVKCLINNNNVSYHSNLITYGPHKAVAEVSNHNEPIGRKSGIQLVRKSMDFTFNCFVLN